MGLLTSIVDGDLKIEGAHVVQDIGNRQGF
jgi:hypothetical protein